MTTANQIFPWREAYSVRIPQIDAQHQQLVGLVNELHAAMLQGNGNDALGRILSELVRYAGSHFSYEEAMLQQRGYSSLTAHAPNTGFWRTRFRTCRRSSSPGDSS
jgi:hemerythrin